jgi:hypothetical protein
VEAPIEVRIAHSILRTTVQEQARAYLRSFGDAANGRRVLISTTGDLTPDQAARMVSDGTAVIILATVPRGDERRAYVAAGAHYVPMSPGESRWTDDLRDVLRRDGDAPL